MFIHHVSGRASTRLFCVMGVLFCGCFAKVNAEETTIERLVRTGKIILPDQVKPGMKGVGRSVFRGTKIESFNVEIIGILNHVNSGGDVVLIKILDGPVVERHSGIIAGMSGSPVYVQGKLLGAVSFGWSFAKEPIAGVTPIADMLRSLDDPVSPKAPEGNGQPKEVALPDSVVVDGARYTKAVVLPRSHRYFTQYGLPSGPSTLGGTICLEPVQTFLLVSGFSPSSLRRLGRIFEPYGLTPIVGPGATTQPFDAPFEPGAAIGAQLVRGDFDISAVGTVTFKDADRVLAFGHPLLGVGELNVPMTNAYVHDIFPSQEVSFKLASPGQAVGAITQDWAWAIGGRMGKRSPMVPVTIQVSDAERKFRKAYHVEVANQKDLLPTLIINSAIEATYAAYGMQTEDTVKIGLKVEAEGLPPVERENLYYDDGYAVLSAVTELAQALSIMTQNDFERAKIKSIELRCEMERTRRSARIKRIFTNKSKIKPGEDIEVGIAIEPHGQPVAVKTVTFTVPKDTPGGMMWIGVASGMSELMLRARLGLHIPIPTNLAELLALYDQLRSNSDLIVKAALPRYGVSVAGKDMPVLPSSIFQVMRSSRSTDVRPVREPISKIIPTEWMITGFQFLSVRIDSKIKPPQISEPGTRPPGMEAAEEQQQPQQNPEYPSSYDTSWLSPFDLDARSHLPRAGLLKFLEAIQSWQSPFPDTELDSRVNRKHREDKKGHAAGDSTNESSSGSTNEEDRSQPATSSSESNASTPPRDSGPGGSTRDKPLGRVPKVWSQSTVQDFLAGTMTNVAVSTKGDVRLAPESKQLFRSDELYFWTVAADRSGNAYVGTGNEGKIYKIPSDGKSQMLLDTKQIAITQLVFAHPSSGGGPGDLFAASSPGGIIYRIDSTGKATTYVKLPVPFIWCMAFDSQGNLYAGTGPKGQIFRIRPDNRCEVAAALPQDHVRTVAIGRDNTLYAGTGDTGVIYRVKLGAKSQGAGSSIEALYNFNSGEITSLALDESGNVYFGTAGKAGIYRIDGSGAVKIIYEPPVQAVYQVLVDDGSLYAATGDPQRQGIVYRINVGGDEAVTRILEADQGQVLGLALTANSSGQSQGKRLLACTGNGAVLYELKLPFSKTGVFESDVFDTKLISKWGHIRWQSSLPKETLITAETRTGNTKIPDESWSSWSAANSNASGSPILSPPGRYIQYRCHLTGSQKASPLLERVELTYLPQNQPPSVTLKSPKGGEYWSGAQSVEWASKDPDNDTLAYQLFLSEDDGATWKPLPMKPTKGNSYSFDTRTFKDGAYRLKVVATDASSNPEGPLTDEAASKSFVIDNHPPLLFFITAKFKKTSDNRFVGKAMALDDVSNIASAEFRVDEGEWKAAVSEEGMFDSRWATIAFQTDPLDSDNHTIELRVRDAAGNVATKKQSLHSIFPQTPTPGKVSAKQ